MSVYLGNPITVSRALGEEVESEPEALGGWLLSLGYSQPLVIIMTYCHYLGLSCANSSLLSSHWIRPQCCEVSRIHMLQTKKLRLRMVKQLAKVTPNSKPALSSLFLIFGQTLQRTSPLLTGWKNWGHNSLCSIPVLMAHLSSPATIQTFLLHRWLLGC